MVSVSIRPVAVSAVALATAGLLAVTPVSSSPQLAVSPPVVHVENIALTGIGQDLYNSITPAVQYVVGGGSYLINFIPLVGGLAAAQININYFQLIQPTVAATVNYLAGVVQDPLNIIPTTQAYGVTLYDIGYNYVSAQLRFLGLQPPAPLPPIAASGRAARMSSVSTVRSAQPGQSKAANPVRPVAASPRGQSRTTPAAARSVARAGSAAAVKRFG